jgi:hypothetical protein
MSQGRAAYAKPFQSLKLSELPLKIEFNPSSHGSNHHSTVLIACSTGLVYVYDPFSCPDGAAEETLPSKGTWIALYSTKFHSADEDELSSGQRKRILDASWASNGRSIITLLADGEWGVWSAPSSQSESSSMSSASSFALWGMIGSGIPSHLAQGPKKLDRSSLPTMTPNTRRVKEANLFVGHVNATTAAPRGGLSVNPILLPSADNTEDSVVLWYNDTVCYVDSLQSYWSRAARRSSEVKMQTAGGSLFGPGLTRIEDLNLKGQHITSVGQVISRHGGAILVSCEHQLVLSSHAAQKPLGKPRTTTLVSRPRSDLHRSQALLEKGELDIDQLDVLMDQMGGAEPGMSGSRLVGDSDGPFMSGALPRSGL